MCDVRQANHEDDDTDNDCNNICVHGALLQKPVPRRSSRARQSCPGSLFPVPAKHGDRLSVFLRSCIGTAGARTQNGETTPRHPGMIPSMATRRRHPHVAVRGPLSTGDGDLLRFGPLRLRQGQRQDTVRERRLHFVRVDRIG
jgi:hypothetical protein